MMKSFFKKLAFVMALAMVVSMVAPAGSALAAASGVSLQGTKTIVETFEFEKAGDSQDFSFQGAPKDWKTTSKWTSSNEAVATVDKMGVVTAVAAGTATITITSGADASYAESVVVTVKEEAKALVAEQVSTDTVKLTFAKAPNADKVKEELKFVLTIAGVDVAIQVDNATVKDNVVTATVGTTFIDGETYTFSLGNDSASFVASSGEIDHVGFDYYTGDDQTKNVGVAYVNTDTEDYYATFIPKFYDANGVDITKKYDVNDFDITYDLVVESDAYEIDMDSISFDKASAAAVTMTVAWTDDDAEDIVKTYTGVVIGEKLPAVKVETVKSGFIKVQDYAAAKRAEARADFQTNPWGPFWNGNISLKDSYKLSYGDNNTYVFAALMQDNRGNMVVTGDAGYGLGEFTFVSSDENVFSISEEGEDGVLEFYEPGSASVLIYFTADDDETETPVLVGAKKLTVKAASYAASYKILNSSITTASDTVDASKNNVSFNLQVYDQYNSPMKLEDPSLITVEASSETNLVTPVDITWNNDWDKKYYQINFDADKFDIEDKKYKSFKYKVSIEKVEDVTDKIKTGTSTITLKVSDTLEAKKALNSYLGSGDLTTAKATEFNYNLGGGYPIDLAVKDIRNFKSTDMQATAKLGWANGIHYLTSSTDLQLAEVPADHFVEIGKDVTTGDVGYFYYRVTAPSKSVERNEDGTLDVTKNWRLSVIPGGFVFQWNSDVTPIGSNDKGDTWDDPWSAAKDFQGYAETGTYAVTVYTAKRDGGKLTAKGTYTFNVSNSQDQAKYVGINEEFGSKTTLDVETQADAIIKKHLVFEFAGNKLDDATDWTTLGYTIDWNKSEVYPIGTNKLRVKKLAIVVPLDDGDPETDYEYTTYVSVNKTIEEE